MLITPNSRIILLKNPIEIDNLNQLTFSNATAQYNYFYGLSKLECDNATYQRKDHVIRIPVQFDSIYNCNYVMYQNSDYSNK